MLLNCHTYYSFCYGTWKPEDLIEHIKKNGYSTFVLSDINNTSACLDTIRIAMRNYGVRPVAGIDFRNGVKQQYIGIARNNEGFRELNAHLSKHLHAGEVFDAIAPAFDHAYVVYPLVAYTGWALRENEFIGIGEKDLPNLRFSKVAGLQHKLVVLHTVSFQGDLTYNAHRLLRAIDTSTVLSKLEVAEQAVKGTGLLPPRKALFAAFAAYPDMISNTEKLLNDCVIHFEYGKLANKNLKSYRGSIAEDFQLLRDESMKGLLYRYPDPSNEVMARVEKELDIITQRDFASYFLINWDITSYARGKGYYYVGRGSGANSIIAYLLRITDVDPIELDLYFERFINLYRDNAPDFDIDFSWTDRDDITRYIFERFGKERTALLGAYNTFQHDSIIRELGKVFGLPPRDIDKLQKVQEHTGKLEKLVLDYSKVLQDFPSHLSIHSSGILISEKPIHYYSATNLPPKGYPTTQFSMLEAEDIGLFKFDILSQRGLGKIKDSLSIIKQNNGVEIDIHNIVRFKEDENVKALLVKEIQ